MRDLMHMAEAGETPLVEKELAASFLHAFGLPGGGSGGARSPGRASTEACAVPPARQPGVIVPVADQQSSLSI